MKQRHSTADARISTGTSDTGQPMRHEKTTVGSPGRLPAVGIAALPYFTGAGPVVEVDWWTVPNPTPSDWIGVHAIGAPDTVYRTWVYTNGKQYGSGRLTIPAGTPPGGYELRLFSNDGLTRLACGEDLGGGFDVVTQALLDPGVSSVGVSPGSTIAPRWSDVPSPTPYDWVGLYARGAPDTAILLNWIYTNGQESGTGNLIVPAGIRTGIYELRLFSNDSLTRLAVTDFNVNGPARVNAVLGGIPNVFPGGQLKFGWGGVQSTGAESDWVGLYRVGASDTDYATWVYISGASGSGQLTIPVGTPPGDHELRLFTDGGFGRLATSQRDANVETTASLKYNAGYPVCPAGQVVAYWQDNTAPTPQDWVGLYAVGAPNSAYLTWSYTNGRSRGRRSLTIPPGITPGIYYELRLFSNDSYTQLGGSGWMLLS